MELLKLIHMVEDEHVGAFDLGNASRSCQKNGLTGLMLASCTLRALNACFASLHNQLTAALAARAMLQLRSCAWRACILHETVQDCVHAVMFLILLPSYNRAFQRLQSF